MSEQLFNTLKCIQVSHPEMTEDTVAVKYYAEKALTEAKICSWSSLCDNIGSMFVSYAKLMRTLPNKEAQELAEAMVAFRTN